MRALIRLVTLPASYQIEFGSDGKAYMETLLPVLKQLLHKKLPLQLTKQELLKLQEMVKADLDKRLVDFKPHPGRGPLIIVSGQEYRLAMLGRGHMTISELYNIYEMTEHCIGKDYVLKFDIPYNEGELPI